MAASNICQPKQPVRWSTMYQLMVDIMQDAAAENSDGKENDPLYNKTLDETSPFYLEDVYQASPALHMVVDENNISNIYLVESPGDTAPWDLPQPLSTLAAQGRLYFVAEADGCFCKTIWRVTGGGGAYTLEKVDAALKMACQSIDVPTYGTSLACTFVPQGAWANMQRRAYSARLKGEKIWTEFKCEGVGGLLFATANGKVQWIQRSMTGYFTWNIAKDDFYQLVEAMLNAFYEWPCGLEKAKWWHSYDKYGTPGAGQMIEDDTAKPGDYGPYVWAWTSKLLANSDGNWDFAKKPGCLELVTTPFNEVKYPWEVATCGDTKRCPDQNDKLLVRCATLLTLDALVQRLNKTVVRRDCVASLKIYNSYMEGHAQACAIDTDADNYYTTIKATNHCTFDGIHFTDCDITDIMTGGIRAWGGTDPAPPSNCSATLDTSDCDGKGDCSQRPADVTKTGGGSFASVLSAAQGAASAAGWVDGTGTLHTLKFGNAEVDGNPFYGGSALTTGTNPSYAYGSTGASVYVGRLKIEAVSLASGHVFKIIVKQQQTVYPDVGDPYTETLATDTHTIGPGETYIEATPTTNGVFLTAEIWHDKKPTSGT